MCPPSVTISRSAFHAWAKASARSRVQYGSLSLATTSAGVARGFIGMGAKAWSATGAPDRSASAGATRTTAATGAVAMAKIAAIQPMLCANMTTGGDVRRMACSKAATQAARSGTIQSCWGTRVAAWPNRASHSVCQWCGPEFCHPGWMRKRVPVFVSACGWITPEHTALRLVAPSLLAVWLARNYCAIDNEVR